jgi:hypothetical protein
MKKLDLTFSRITLYLIAMGKLGSRATSSFLALLFAFGGDGILFGKNGSSPRDQLVQKIQTIIIPKIEFTEVPLPEALNFLSAEARKHDPQKMGVNIVLLTREKTPPKITLNIRNLSLGSSLGFVTELAGYVYEVREQAIVVSKPIPQAKKQVVNPRLQTEIYELSEGLKRRLVGNP